MCGRSRERKNNFLLLNFDGLNFFIHNVVPNRLLKIFPGLSFISEVHVHGLPDTELVSRDDNVVLMSIDYKFANSHQHKGILEIKTKNK